MGTGKPTVQVLHVNMPKRVSKCTTKEKDPRKAAKRLKNNEAARRYRERKRRQLELKQKTWEALQRDHSKLYKHCFRKKRIQKIISLIKDPITKREWKRLLLLHDH